MTNLDKKKFLGKYAGINLELKRLALERDRLRTYLTRVSEGMSKEKIAAHLHALDADTDARIHKLLLTRAAIYDALESVPDETQRALLRYRYLEQYSPLQTSFKLFLSQRQFYRLQNYALRALVVPENFPFENETDAE
ncbi:MAG: hypothetical protein KIG36_01215 [Eubacteriales bacterium]|nr:hypothetical protein [Eubacteriales bacterium]